jgi:hypothetical protein
MYGSNNRLIEEYLLSQHTDTRTLTVTGEREREKKEGHTYTYTTVLVNNVEQLYDHTVVCT